MPVIAPDPDAVAAARADLAQADPALARAHAMTPAFEWRLRPGGFEGLFRMIVEQQVSVAAAASIWRRVGEGLGEITPEAVLARDIDSLRPSACPARRRNTVRRSPAPRPTAASTWSTCRPWATTRRSPP